MDWQEIKASILKGLGDRNLANPRIRINALESIERLIKTNYPGYIQKPKELLLVGKNDFKERLSKYKKLNSAETSIINNLFDVIADGRITGEYLKQHLTETKKQKKPNKPEIVDSCNKMSNPQIGLLPWVDSETMILILGTFPAKESLEKKTYYYNQKTRFWTQALGPIGDFSCVPNEERKKLLLSNQIGLWDIFECVEKKNSNQDKDIIKGKYNNLPQLLDEHSSIKYILFNGQNAYKWLCDEHKKSFEEKKIKNEVMQSTSGANSHFNNGESWQQFFKGLADK